MSYRVISSRQTELGWVTSPLIFLAGTVLLIGVFNFGWFTAYYRTVFPGGLSPVEVNLAWGGWLLFSLFSLWWTYRFKRVAVDGESVYLADFLQRDKLPLREVLDVTENRWVKTHPVTIEFAGATRWGHRVRFIPKRRFLVPNLVSHPSVLELREMVRWAKLNDRVTAKLQQDSTLPSGTESRSAATEMKNE